MYSHSILKKLSAREGFDFDYKYTEMHSKFYRTVLIHRNISKKSMIAVHRKGVEKQKNNKNMVGFFTMSGWFNSIQQMPIVNGQRSLIRERERRGIRVCLLSWSLYVAIRYM